MRYAVSSYAHNINRRGAAMTIKEIANSLGVSTATVSNVIHGLSLIHISEPTRP